jgi:pyruvate/2-oxoglutarate dehydrogenase complex dihydrolipoamide acyltransferase (E2) component
MLVHRDKLPNYEKWLGSFVYQKLNIITIRPMVYLMLTFDHRMTDGVVADYFLAEVMMGVEGSW